MFTELVRHLLVGRWPRRSGASWAWWYGSEAAVAVLAGWASPVPLSPALLYAGMSLALWSEDRRKHPPHRGTPSPLNSTSTPEIDPPGWARSYLAIVAGGLSWLGISTGPVEHVFAGWGVPSFWTTDVFSCVVGGLVTAALSERNPVFHAIVLGIATGLARLAASGNILAVGSLVYLLPIELPAFSAGGIVGARLARGGERSPGDVSPG